MHRKGSGVSDTVILDAHQRAAVDAVNGGGHVHVVGGPGTGKTTVALAVMESADERFSHGRPDLWAPALFLVPDRRRARETDVLLAHHFEGRLAGLRTDGSHRLVRALSSYAYLVLGLWLIEREVALERPVMLSGADEDAWLTRFLDDSAVAVREVPEAVRRSPLFRMEIRNIMARCGQAGLFPEDLETLGRDFDKSVWRVAAAAYGAYAGGRSAFTISSPHIDPARMPRIAANILRDWDSRADEQRVTARKPVPGVVIVDDSQDLPRSALPLLKELAASGCQVVIAGSRNEAVAAFRGGTPELGELCADELAADRVLLFENHRSAPRVIPAIQEVEGWLEPPKKATGGGGADPEPQTLGATDAGGGGIVVGESLATQSHLAERVSEIFRSSHLFGGVAWKDMAVVVRHADAVDGIARALGRSGVPVQSGERPVVLSKVPLVFSMLSLLSGEEQEVSAGETDRIALDLAVSPLVRVDSLGLFRVMRDFRGQNETGGPTGIAALLEAIDSGEYQPTAPSLQSSFRGLKVASKLWSVRDAAAIMPAQQGLWRVWELSGLAETLRDTALQDSSVGRSAAEDLDSMLALFRKADLWSQEKMAMGSTVGDARAFSRQILNQTIATDPLVPRGLSESGVWIVTPTQAAGREWETVVVAGLDEGVWPSALRRGLGDLPTLEGILEDARQRGWPGEKGIDRFLPDRSVAVPFNRGASAASRRVEEARLFLVALSRSRGDVHLLALENEDASPSTFLTNLLESGVVSGVQDGGVADPGRLALTIPGLISQMRQRLVADRSTAEEKGEAARVLALLWQEGVEQADPGLWATSGSLSTDSPVLDQGPVRLGPSSIQTAADCGLKWFLQDIGGRNQELHSEAKNLDGAMIGTIMHTLAEKHPHAGPSEMKDALDDVWQELGLTLETYWERVAFSEMTQMATRMGVYFSSFKGEVLTEQAVKFAIGDVLVSGRADRIEIDEDGLARIIDVKTGKSDVNAKGEENAQLAAYQVGVTELGYQTGGAALLALRSDNSLKVQTAFSKEQMEDTKEFLRGLGVGLGGPRIMANPEVSRCRSCAFRHVCPAQSDSVRSCE